MPDPFARFLFEHDLRANASRCGATQRLPHEGFFVTGRYERLVRRRFMNVAKNRPETTNLNHQYAIRRVFMCLILDPWCGPGRHDG